MKKTIRLTESDLIGIVKRVVKESQINELSPSTFFSATRQSSIDRGTPKRTNQLSNLFFNKLIGMDLLDGTIEDIDVEYSGIDHVDEFIVITIGYPEDENNPTKKIMYDVNNDEYHNIDYDIDRRDSVKLGRIAASINPDTKYKETGKHLKIRGFR